MLASVNLKSNLPAGNYSVSLSEGCSGEVKLNNQHVCNRNWKSEFSHRVCQDMGCSNAFEHYQRGVTVTGVHVSCLGSESLGQCMKFNGSCGTPPISVFCTSEWGKVKGGGDLKSSFDFK